MIKLKNILSINADAKTIKSNSAGILTGILYLAPYNLSGVNLCPFAKVAGCADACLYSAGRGKFSNVQLARINKAKMFNDNRALFMDNLIFSIHALIKKAKKLNLTPAVRLNGTSDISWEDISFNYKGVEYTNIMALFSDIQFYDYTKNPLRKDLPNNYDLTFSYSGVKSFDKYNKLARLNSALNRIAVVFDKRENIPAQFLGLNTIDGDSTDARFMDDKSVIVALYAKGEAKKDASGFVVKI